MRLSLRSAAGCLRWHQRLSAYPSTLLLTVKTALLDKEEPNGTTAAIPLVVQLR